MWLQNSVLIVDEVVDKVAEGVSHSIRLILETCSLFHDFFKAPHTSLLVIHLDVSSEGIYFVSLLVDGSNVT